jgi:hypothetical protein
MRTGNHLELVTRGGYHIAAPVSETDDMVSVGSNRLPQDAGVGSITVVNIWAEVVTLHIPADSIDDLFPWLDVGSDSFDCCASTEP